MTHAYLRSGDDVTVTQRCSKRAYESLKDARRAMGSGIARKRSGLVAVGKGRMNAYRCPICRAYHLGHRL